MIVPALFGFLAFIHLLPAVAAIAPSQISRLYGVDAADSTLVTLLQHRAVLLGLVGLAFLAAAFRPNDSVALLALLLGGASMVTFLIIAALQRELAGPLKTIALVDAVGLMPLAYLAWRQPWTPQF